MSSVAQRVGFKAISRRSRKGLGDKTEDGTHILPQTARSLLRDFSHLATRRVLVRLHRRRIVSIRRVPVRVRFDPLAPSQPAFPVIFFDERLWPDRPTFVNANLRLPRFFNLDRLENGSARRQGLPLLPLFCNRRGAAVYDMRQRFQAGSRPSGTVQKFPDKRKKD